MTVAKYNNNNNYDNKHLIRQSKRGRPLLQVDKGCTLAWCMHCTIICVVKALSKMVEVQIDQVACKYSRPQNIREHEM